MANKALLLRNSYDATFPIIYFSSFLYSIFLIFFKFTGNNSKIIITTITRSSGSVKEIKLNYEVEIIKLIN